MGINSIRNHDLFLHNINVLKIIFVVLLELISIPGKLKNVPTVVRYKFFSLLGVNTDSMKKIHKKHSMREYFYLGFSKL